MAETARSSAPDKTAGPAGVLAGDDATFAAIEGALQRTPLGAWFLREVTARARRDETHDIVKAVEAIRTSMEGQKDGSQIDLVQKELKEMAQAIVQTRQAISEIKPDVPVHDRIFAAKEELDAILTATEQATSDILGAAESLQAIVGDMREAGVDSALCDRLDTLAIDIFTACTFQDICGQRTTKIVSLLRFLEQRLNSMLEIWGVTAPVSLDGGGQAMDTDASGAPLASGPSLPGQGVNQDDVDAMLEDMGMSNGDIDAMFD